MKIEEKHLPDPANIMNNYFKAYDAGFDKLDHRSKEKSSGSPAGSCQQCESFGNLLFAGEQNHCHTILQLVHQMKHLDCFYSNTTSPQQETRNHMIQWKRMKRKRIWNKVMEMEMEMEMQNWEWQPRKKQLGRKSFPEKNEKSTRRLCCLVSEIPGPPQTKTGNIKLSPKCH